MPLPLIAHILREIRESYHFYYLSLEVLGVKYLKLKSVDMDGLSLLVSQEIVDSLRLHFPHIDWIRNNDLSDEEDQDQEEEE